MSCKPKRALVVETTNRITIGNLLVEFGITVVQAKTGAEAIKIYEEDPSFDLVIMDIDMPGINGFSAARLIRQYQMAKRPWIIGLASDFRHRERALQAGIDLFVTRSLAESSLQNKMVPFSVIQGAGRNDVSHLKGD